MGYIKPSYLPEIRHWGYIQFHAKETYHDHSEYLLKCLCDRVLGIGIIFL